MTTEEKYIYFASDFHLGAPDYESSLIREKKIVEWLTHIQANAAEIYLVGDLFDFWFEYKRAVPRGYVRLLGKLAELTDKGIPVHVFTGNHDMWIFDYLPKETGVQLYRAPIERTFFGKSYVIGHGDGLGPGDKGYKFLKKVFANKFCQWCFARLHPNFGIWLADVSSRTSRAKSKGEDEKFLGEDREWLIQYCKSELQKRHTDFFIFGHRHLPLDFELSPTSRYINLGEWINYRTYLEVRPDGVELKTWE
ncbi:MAG: UDP-2,3-diacylglucosamine hydrolase [Bacteroidetes bacterium RIFCSPHIGHO2_02_FULL_44_7]|nr:MAG: UDP-2,3-diacylglucosamine hydrolase [Bacteroidetes bacterium RIFCSPHIGHO2_02_FULL_44_7]